MAQHVLDLPAYDSRDPILTDPQRAGSTELILATWRAGELTVSRALGDFHLAQLKFRSVSGSFQGPLTAEPEVWLCRY